MTAQKKLVMGLVLSFSVGFGFVSTAAVADGHCTYKQFSPRVNKWYAMCQMPGTRESCDSLAMSRGISEVKFAEGACSSRALVGACVVGGQNLFFYDGSAETVTKGCEMLGGSWRPNLKPQ